jgi:hypothetical protein
MTGIGRERSDGRDAGVRERVTFAALLCLRVALREA